MSFRLKFKPTIGASKDRRGSGPTLTTPAATERGNTSSVTATESLTKESCRLILSSAESKTGNRKTVRTFVYYRPYLWFDCTLTRTIYRDAKIIASNACDAICRHIKSMLLNTRGRDGHAA